MVSKIRALRLLRGMSLYELSKLTDIEVGKLSLWERNYKKLRPDELERVCGVLQVEVPSQKEQELLQQPAMSAGGDSL